MLASRPPLGWNSWNTFGENISDALISKSGAFGGLYDFMLQYEKASWQEVSRQMILQDISMNDLYQAYIQTLEWYRKLTLGK